ncbi:GMC family oxidoreductase [Mucilaginibacter conchicola]|uniref:GMC family oxidoreductase n=1 Tax=Mucilaginibacter conchicola TaxID=2303333 RepID=A0A372NUZ6_9SPHI|nr:GMC family oxidoreductase [Mucilaginibacter conchicola]RFZ93993.1 GMC family oxidoreductase [Mucilaginibacter conchicola]
MFNDININSGGVAANTFDAIVIGSGISGGWAAKEFCEKGLKTLVLERGRNVEHIKDYTTANTPMWDMQHRGQMNLKDTEENPIVNRCYAYNEYTSHFFVKDNEHPYKQVKPFDWIRGYQVGGKSLIWGRWTQRWSDLDFEANAKQGVGVDWPIRYKDIAPWYSYVEKFVGISGNRDGIPHLPDGEFLPPMPMNALEKHLQQSIATNYTDRQLIMSRTANLSKGLKDRGPCQYRDMCARGCPFSGYFSSNSATLPAARATGNLTLRPFSVVHSIIYDDKTQKAKGVSVIDTQTKKVTEYFAKVIFVNAGTLNSTLLLMNSTSNRFPDGFGNDSGALGHYLMDHNYRGHINAEYHGLQDVYTYGRRPTGVYVPRFRNVGKDLRKDYQRGFAIAAGGSRRTGDYSVDTIGAPLKNAMSDPGVWDIWMNGMGECLPYEDNKISLSKTDKDAWGIPQLEIDCSYRENELSMLKDILTSGQEMLEKAGFKNVEAYDSNQNPGQGIHEMGTARMGRDPKTSVLNGNNQVWGAKNVFVTDGACMVSSACQNPSLTYMALTARAVDFAVAELKKQNI